MVKALGGKSTEAASDAMAHEVVNNSAIEGVTLDMEAVRASMSLRLGIETHLVMVTTGDLKRVDPIVGVLAEAVEGWKDPLTVERIFGWHRALFPKGVSDGGTTLPSGEFRGDWPMVVATPSHRPGEPDTIHYEAPGRDVLEHELSVFLDWFNEAPQPTLNGLLRAGLAHLWFITLHPMLDGNGRLARTLTDLALSQDERASRRFYSLSVQIMKNKAAYYDALEHAQRGSLDVSDWLEWFLSQVETAAREGVREIGRVLARSAYWAEVEKLRVTERQGKVLHGVLSPMSPEMTISNRRYRAITGVSRATAKRDLAELAEKGLVVPFGQARAASYRVNLDPFLPDAFRMEE
jgi:Fic family protein